MADVFHRTNGTYMQSVNTPDFTPANWIINPNLSAVVGWPVKYWIVDPPGSDIIRLATVGERAAIDQAIANSQIPDRAIVQAKRNTVYDVTTAWADVTLNNTDIETNTAIVDHNNTLTDRITLVAAGTYRINYKIDTQSPEQSNDMCRLQGRVRVNDTTVIPGSFSQTNIVNDSSLDSFEMNDQQLIGFCTYTATAGQFVTLQLQIINLGGSSMNIDTQNITLMVTYLGA